MNRHYVSLLAVATLLVAMPVHAQSDDGADVRAGHAAGGRHGPGMRGMHDPARFAERLQRRLELDDVQRQAIENVLLAAKPEMEALRERARAHRAAAAALAPGADNYDAVLEQQAREASELAAEKVRLLGRVRADVATQLTEEQRAGLDAMMSERRDRRGARRGGDRKHRH